MTRLRSAQPLGRGIVLGVVGLVVGYWGPLRYSPSLSQGPLLGLFFTGPLGFVLGCAFGLLVNRVHVSPIPREGIFLSLILLVGGGAFVLSQPDPVPIGIIVDGVIRGCQIPATMIPDTEKRWQDLAVSDPSITLRPGWEAEMAGALKQSTLIVVDLNVARVRNIYRRREGPRERIFAKPWTPVRWSQGFLMAPPGPKCAGYHVGSRALLWLPTQSGQGAGGSVEKLVARWLDISEVQPVPRYLVGFAD